MESNTATLDDIHEVLRSMDQMARIQSMTDSPPAARPLNELWVRRVQRNVNSSRAMLDGMMTDSEWEDSSARDNEDFEQIRSLHRELRDECALY
jgi:hypothetical protein